MKYRGCAYYPEFWGRERFEEDARLMQDAGINIARIGEFAWSRMEPEEGVYTLDWLHEVVEVLGRRGIQVLMCTPTATPPVWLTSAYRDTLLTELSGRKMEHGRRKHYCPTSDTYRRFCASITEKLATEMSRHENVTCWQIDNELGPEVGGCFCKNCQARFQSWLKVRYGTIDELNRRWATGFWSTDYTDWRQVRMAEPGVQFYSSRQLDTLRFRSEMLIEFCRHQAKIIRANHPAALVTTNGMGPIFEPINYYELFADLDVAPDDLYFDIATQDANAAAMNAYRSYKPGKRYWITETGSGALSHEKPPMPGQFRAWAWSNLAHGGDGHFVFRWRTCLSGQEQELQGMLEHSGKPRHRYQAVQRCFKEFEALQDELKDLPLPEAPVAIVQDYDTLWSYQAARIGKDVQYLQRIFALHKELYDRNIVADIIPTDRDLAGYKLVVLPSTVIINEDFAARLRAFVKNGGTLLAFGQIGMRDSNSNYLADPGPDHLHDLLGVNIEGGMYLTSAVGPDEALWAPQPHKRQVEIPVRGTINGQEIEGKAQTWIADLTLNGGDVLLEFEGEAYKGQPAMVEKQTGSGRAIYLGAISVDHHIVNPGMEYVLKLANVQAGPETPEYVEVIRRGSMIFVVNHTDQPVTVALQSTGTAIVGEYEAGLAKLEAYGVCVISEQ